MGTFLTPALRGLRRGPRRGGGRATPCCQLAQRAERLQDLLAQPLHGLVATPISMHPGRHQPRPHRRMKT
eukprot:7822146-Alexandrium_andersonii.AAC.1